jgi:hypothetical protein
MGPLICVPIAAPMFRSHLLRTPLHICLLSSAALFHAGAAMAQPLTDIGLFAGTAPNTVEVRLRPDAAFSQVVSSLTFTVRWETASGATIDPPASLSLGLNCPSGIPLSPSSDGVRTDGAFSYYTFNAFGFSTLTNACPTQVWQANVERVIATIPVRPGASCANFAIVNDAYTQAQNKNFFISLNGLPRTDLIYGTPVRVLRGDLNRDGLVNTSDFAIFISAFGSACTGCAADLDQNGTVNTSDFSLFILAFGQSCL